jgi:hypothetical protein
LLPAEPCGFAGKHSIMIGVFNRCHPTLKVQSDGQIIQVVTIARPKILQNSAEAALYSLSSPQLLFPCYSTTVFFHRTIRTRKAAECLRSKKVGQKISPLPAKSSDFTFKWFRYNDAKKVSIYTNHPC